MRRICGAVSTIARTPSPRNARAVKKKKAIKCEQCGAPLDPRGAEAWVECIYCGAVHELDTPKKPAPTSAPDDDEPGIPAPVLVGSTMAVTVLVVVGGVVLLLWWLTSRQRIWPQGGGVTVTSRSHRPRAFPRHYRPASERVTWRTHGTCPVDADGDGIRDVASMAWNTKQKDRITVISGADGRVLWQGRSMKQNTPFYCLGKSWLAVEHPGFKVEIYHARHHKKPIATTLPGKVSYVAMGDGCVALKTNDGTVTTLRLPAGTPGTCRTGKLRRARMLYHGVTQRYMKRGRVTRDGTTYEVRMRRQGTPMLTAEARRGRRRLWTRKLGLMATSYGTALALVKDRLVIFGARPTRERSGVLLGLDPKTGAQIYDQELRHESPQTLTYWDYNGRHLVLAAWVGLHAFDPATGKRIWSVGN